MGSFEGGIYSVGLDWDDLYVQTTDAKFAHHKEVAAGFGYELKNTVLKKHWGKGLRKELPIFYGFGENVSDEQFEVLLAAFNKLSPKYPKPLQNDTLRFHNNMKHAHLPLWILTSHLTANAISEVTATGLDVADFDFIEGSDRSPAIKPNKLAFGNALAHLETQGINPGQAVYLGDTLGDFKSSTGAGLQFIGVTTGRNTIEEFRDAGATVVPSLLLASRLILANSQEAS